MAQKALKQANQPQLEKPRKAAYLLGKFLKYPISGDCAIVGDVIPCGEGVNDTPVMVAPYLICDSHSLLGDIGLLISEFEFSLKDYLNNQRFHSSSYRKVLNMVLANLRLANLEGSGLSIPSGRRSFTWNNPESIKYPTLNNVIDYFEHSGLVTVYKGRASKDKALREPRTCWPTAELVEWFEINRIRPILHAKTDLIELRQKTVSHYNRKRKVPKLIDDKWVTVTESKRVKVTTSKRIKILKKDKAKAALLTETVSIYNSMWLNHTPTLEGNYLLPWTKRIFNNSLDCGGRFYGRFQKLSKQQRAKILIDGLSTVEPDYSGYHINLLYTWQDKQLKGDPYIIDGFNRDLIKAVMLPLLNSENLSKLAGQITKSANPEIKTYYARWNQKQAIYTTRRSYGQHATRPDKPDYLQGFIEGIPEGTNGKDVIEAIKQKHPLIAHHFGTKDIGIRLQGKDSEIMAAVLCELAKQGIPALPIHDSLRVKAMNEMQVVEIMQSEYKRLTGFEIEVSHPNKAC